MKKRLYLLAAGAVFFTLTGVRWNVPVAAWIWPVCMLAYLRANEKKTAPLLAAAAMVLGSMVNIYGALDGGAAVDHLVGVIAGLLAFLPFLPDRFAAKRLKGVARTLVLPTAFAAMEVLQSFLPTGILGSFSASQADNKPLVQLACVFGSYGVTFLVIWAAPVLCELFDALSAKDAQAAPLKGCKRPLIVYSAVLVAVLLFGGVRLAFAPFDAPTIKAALVTSPFSGSTMEDYDDYELTLEDNVASLTKSAQSAAGGKADILVCCEEAFYMPKADEEAFLSAAAEVARESALPIILGLDVEGDADGLNENKLVCIDSQGNIVWDYHKGMLIPLMEDDYVASEGSAQVFDLKTARGVQVGLSAVVCFDSDHPAYVRNAVPKEADVLLIPTWDWAAIRAYHTKWVELRAVENGMSIVRSTYNGVSTAADPYGRVLMYSDTAGGGYENVVFAEVPTDGTPTLYGAFGDVIDLAYIAALLALTVLSVIKGCKAKKKTVTE